MDAKVFYAEAGLEIRGEWRAADGTVGTMSGTKALAGLALGGLERQVFVRKKKGGVYWKIWFEQLWGQILDDFWNETCFWLLWFHMTWWPCGVEHKPPEALAASSRSVACGAAKWCGLDATRLELLVTRANLIGFRQICWNKPKAYIFILMWFKQLCTGFLYQKS